MRLYSSRGSVVATNGQNKDQVSVQKYMSHKSGYVLIRMCIPIAHAVALHNTTFQQHNSLMLDRPDPLPFT